MRSYNKASADVSVQDTEVTVDSKSDWLDEKCCTLTNRCYTISQFLLASGKEYFVAAAWRLWQTLITGALPSWIQTSDYRNSPKKRKKETPSWSVFQPYVKHRRPASPPPAKDSSVFQMSPREQCLWNQFHASLEMAAERDCRRGWDVAARHQSSSPGRTCDLQTSRRRNPGGASFFFFYLHVYHLGQDGGDASVWPRD